MRIRRLPWKTTDRFSQSGVIQIDTYVTTRQLTVEQPGAERQRQRALESYRVLDTLPEAAYEDIVRLASVICGVPIAMVSLIDRERQWFKAVVGIDVQQTPRGIAFCDHAIREPNQLMEVSDAQLDPRFVDNPLVAGDPGIRFYAGMPILSGDGFALGTVCVIDSQPHVLSDTQREALQLLSRLTTELLESRRSTLRLERRQAERDFANRPAAMAAAPQQGQFAVAVVAVEGLVKLRAQQGETAVNRVQEALQARLPEELVCPHGEGEFLLILSRGERVVEQLTTMRDSVESEAGLALTIGGAIAAGADEAMELVFERAEQALAQARSRAGSERLVVDGQVRA